MVCKNALPATESSQQVVGTYCMEAEVNARQSIHRERERTLLAVAAFGALSMYLHERPFKKIIISCRLDRSGVQPVLHSSHPLSGSLIMEFQHRPRPVVICPSSQASLYIGVTVVVDTVYVMSCWVYS